MSPVFSHMVASEIMNTAASNDQNLWMSLGMGA